MLILAGTLLALALVPVLGGRLSGLTEVGVRRGWTVPAALGSQVLAISIVPTWPRPLLVALHALSYLLAGWFVWTNRRVPGLVLLAGGGALNALAIAANGGQMPASPQALQAAGLPLVTDHFVNSGVVADPRLAFLGDVFASPAWLPLRNVYSVGDLVILAGAVWVVQRACGTVLARDPRPALRRMRRSAAPEPVRDPRRAGAEEEREPALADPPEVAPDAQPSQEAGRRYAEPWELVRLRHELTARAAAELRLAATLPPSRQPGLQAGAHRRPLLAHDAVDDGVAEATVLAPHVAAEHALALRPQPGDRRLGADVEEVRLDLHPAEAAVVEAVRQ